MAGALEYGLLARITEHLNKIAWSFIIPTVLAIYGAGLSTYIAFTARREKRHQLQVAISHGFLVAGPHLGPTRVMVVASNSGHRPIVLQSAGMRLLDGRD